MNNPARNLNPPPPDLVNHCSQFCMGLWNGCSYGGHHQLNCHLGCSPRSCKQCREVGDADWIRRGQWLEDCISWEEEDEHERRGGGHRKTTGRSQESHRYSRFRSIIGWSYLLDMLGSSHFGHCMRNGPPFTTGSEVQGCLPGILIAWLRRLNLVRRP